MPVDTGVGNGPNERTAHRLSMRFHRELVAAGGGRMLGRATLGAGTSIRAAAASLAYTASAQSRVATMWPCHRPRIAA